MLRCFTHTLTGHSGKVMAAKFLGQSARVVTGSHDRTLKIWDLRSRACVETKFAGSSCNDVVTSEAFSFISGHFDKRIRFWDARCDGTLASGSGMKQEVCSFSSDNFKVGCDWSRAVFSPNGQLVSAGGADGAVFVWMKQEVCSFSSDNFKVGCDWSRAVFSPNGQLVSAGGADGAVFVWSASSGRLVCESNNREHGSAVTAVAWHPFGFFLASVDRGKKAIIWGCE
ncbi:hypothetical protein B566_EDAN001749 [Ephemera danica]|nr:hypothetical protein B566_EDAN001749 [Ephemera danica]